MAMTSLIFDERGFGPAEHRIPWTELRALGIRTTASGPWVEDVFWMFLSRSGLTEIPGQAMTGAELEALQAHLPGIDNEKIVRAMGCAEDRMFRIWHPDAERAGWDDSRGRTRFGALVERLGADPKAAGDTFHYTFKLHSFDGTSLAASLYPSKLGSSAPVVMLIHEANRSRKDFEEPVSELKGQGLAEYLQAEGYAVFTMDLRGQGQNPRRALTSSDRPLMADCSRWCCRHEGPEAVVAPLLKSSRPSC